MHDFIDLYDICGSESSKKNVAQNIHISIDKCDIGEPHAGNDVITCSYQDGLCIAALGPLVG